MGASGEDSFPNNADDLRIYNGQIRRVVDEKNRINVPARWRDERYGEFHALPDSTQPCLKLFNADELRRLKQTVDESPDYTPAQKKNFRRYWFSRAMPCPIDKQGRIVLPPEFQTRFQFSGEVLMVGACECLELWKLEDWEAAQQAEREGVERMAAEMGL